MENMTSGGMDHSCGSHCGKCNCMHHKIMPLMIVLIALTLLAGRLSILSASTVSLLWPVWLLIIGGTKLMSGSCKCYMNPVK